jgi:hypothetical protein
MHAFDAPMHGKHMNLREFSSKYDPRTADVEVDECDRGACSWTLFARLFPVCGAGAMTSVYALRREATDWGPEAALIHFFLAVFLPLRIYVCLCFPDKTQPVWPSLALHATLMLFAYPYDVERVSVVVFCAVLLAAGLHTSRCVRTRSLAANAAAMLSLLNGVLCLIVYNNDSRLTGSYYHCSFVLLCLALFLV